MSLLEIRHGGSLQLRHDVGPLIGATQRMVGFCMASRILVSPDETLLQVNGGVVLHPRSHRGATSRDAVRTR